MTKELAQKGYSSMPRITPEERLLYSLVANETTRRNFRLLKPDEAYRKLKELSGEDFGYDVNKWRKWLNEHQPYGDTPINNSSE